MASEDDFWPDEAFQDLGLVPPVTILREQANALTKRSKGVLRGEVDTSSSGSRLIHLLYVAAPAMDYRVAIIRVDHSPQEMYPVDVSLLLGPMTQVPFVCANDADYRAALKRLLADKQVAKVVSNLLAQATTD